MIKTYKILFISIFSLVLFFINYIIFYPILNASNLIFPYAVHPFDIPITFPKIWHIIKIFYCVSSYVSIFVILNSIFLFKVNKKKKSKRNILFSKGSQASNINLLVGINSKTNEKVYINESGLYQNVLITGTIGSRKNKFCYVSFF